MSRTNLIVVLTALTLLAGLARASEEDIASWRSVTFVATAGTHFGDTTVTVDTDGTVDDLRITRVVLKGEAIDLTLPAAAFADAKYPRIETARLSYELSRCGSPFLNFSVTLGNPRPGEPWDHPRLYVAIHDGRIVRRYMKHHAAGQVKYEELPMPTEAKPSAKSGC